MTDYSLIKKELQALLNKDDPPISSLSNSSALLKEMIEDINWVGFYQLNNDYLELGPFQGKVACVRLPLSRGVCARAVRKNSTIVVDNVEVFDGHIACDTSSKSEIVIPLRKGNEIFGVLDIDSPKIARFSELDKIGLELIAHVIEDIL